MLPEGGRVVLGRSEDVDVQIFDVSISRLHCLFERDRGQVFLADLNSSNGTWVNGRRVSRQMLNQGDAVRLGNIEFVFHCEEATAAGTVPAEAPIISEAAGIQLNAAMKMLRATVAALVGTLEARDNYTHGHSARVTQYALTLGGGLALSSEDLAVLELAGILHDVGKIGIPDGILRKTGPLSANESEIVRQHPMIGYRILSQVEGAETVAAVVLHHHERWDGAGYPRGIVGEKIPLLARILAVADSFDALGSNRPYRPAWHQTKVVEEIARGAGTQFDPKVVEVFVKQASTGIIAVEHELVLRMTVKEKLPEAATDHGGADRTWGVA
jgi:HD-GYP domain-containing protein (c-di-GMP phosphodiesterase class II)